MTSFPLTCRMTGRHMMKKWPHKQGPMNKSIIYSSISIINQFDERETNRLNLTRKYSDYIDINVVDVPPDHEKKFDHTRHDDALSGANSFNPNILGE